MFHGRRDLALLAAALVGCLLATGCKEDAVRVVYPEDLEQIRGAEGPPTSPYDPEEAPAETAEDDGNRTFQKSSTSWRRGREVNGTLPKCPGLFGE